MIRIQRFQPEQGPAVTALVLQILNEEFDIPVQAEHLPDLQDVPGFYQQGGGGFWVAVDQGGELLACLGLRDLGGRQGALRKMYVKASHRGRTLGLAQRLLQTLLEAAGASGMREIFLGTTEQFAAACRFYEGQGFEALSESDLPSSFPRLAPETRFYRLALPLNPSAGA